MRRLILSPHMDDESMGCGGLLARYPGECRVVTFADSGPVRAAEQVRALAVLGVRDYRNLGLPDGALGERMAELVGVIDAEVRHYRPHEMYLPFPSLHQDHIALYEAGMRASRISMSESHWFTRNVLVYDVAVYDLTLYPTDLRWNVFQELTEREVELKAKACLQYASETPEGDHPMTAIKELAAAVGKTRKLPYAEQYALVRQVRR